MRAAASFLSWLEELSGPGPFTGPVFSVPLKCVQAQPGPKPRCDPDGPQPTATITVKYGHFYSNRNRPRFKDLNDAQDDNRGVVRLDPVSAIYLVRLNRSLEVGAGAGVMRLSGDHFRTFHRLVLTPLTASVTPLTLVCPQPGWLKRVGRVLRIDVDAMLVPEGFRGTDFNNHRTKFQSGPDILFHAGVVVDFLAFGRRGPAIP